MHYCYLFIGPSGSGKTTLAAACFDQSQKIISYTTRPKRAAELSGRDYHFISKEQFVRMQAQKAFAETDTYQGFCYGIAIKDLTAALADGDCFNAATAQGFWSLRRLFGSRVIPVYLLVSQTVMRKRMEKRGDPPAAIKNRSQAYQSSLADLKKLQKIPELIVIDADSSQAAMIAQLKQHLRLSDK